jgi:hypothetical protein
MHVSFAEDFVWGGEDERLAFSRLRSHFGPMTLQRFAEFGLWSGSEPLR